MEKKELQSKLKKVEKEMVGLNQNMIINQQNWVKTFEQLNKNAVLSETGNFLLFFTKAMVTLIFVLFTHSHPRGNCIFVLMQYVVQGKMVNHV